MEGTFDKSKFYLAMGKAIGDDDYLYPYGVTPEQASKEYITLG